MIWQNRAHSWREACEVSEVSRRIFPVLVPLSTYGEVVEALSQLDPLALEQLRLNQLSPLLYRELMRHGYGKSVSPPFIEMLRNDYLLALHKTIPEEQETSQLITAFIEAGIEVILLKGADLRLRLYGDSAVRPVSDLDLLIAPEKAVTGGSILERMGFILQAACADPRPGFRRLFRNELHFAPPPGLPLLVDLHWEINGGDQFYRLPFPPLWQAAVSLEFQGIPFKVLAPEHALTHLCLHLFSGGGIIQIIDIVLALHSWKVDWLFFLGEVERFHCRAPVYLILREMDKLFPMLIPEMVLQELSRYRPTRAEKLVLHRTLGYFTCHFARLYHHRTLSEWVFYISSLLWPKTEYLQAVYGKPNRMRFFQQFFKTLFSNAKIWSPH